MQHAKKEQPRMNMDARISNPKSEIRIPKEARNPNTESGVTPPSIRPSGVGFPSDFGIRISGFFIRVHPRSSVVKYFSSR